MGEDESVAIQHESLRFSLCGVPRSSLLAGQTFVCGKASELLKRKR
jgi:hypothetical protein